MLLLVGSGEGKGRRAEEKKKKKKKRRRGERTGDRICGGRILTGVEFRSSEFF